MKKIIGGKRYDTQTARLVASYDDGLPVGDFYSLHEKLYRKKTGEFFLYGQGGAQTRWATKTGHGRGWGEGIMPLTEDEARAWVERYANDQYEIIFGECEE